MCSGFSAKEKNGDCPPEAGGVTSRTTPKDPPRMLSRSTRLSLSDASVSSDSEALTFLALKVVTTLGITTLEVT